MVDNSCGKVHKKMKDGMRCVCGKVARYKKDLRFNQYTLDGWECPHCGEVFFNPVQAEKILLLNKLKKNMFRLRLSQVKSNLILRIPKQVSTALDLHKGDEVSLGMDKQGRIVIKAD
jgi:rRNA maturation protein Nop10